MTEYDDRDTGPRNARDRERTPEPDPVGSVLNLVDDLQRKVLSAGVRRGVDTVLSRPKEQEDVWGEAIRLETPASRPPAEEVLDIVRKAAPEVAGHLGRAGLSLADAAGRTWGVLERSMEQAREEARAAREAEQGTDRSGGNGDSPQTPGAEGRSGP